MLNTNLYSREEAKTKGQTKQPCSNHTKQLSLQNTTGKKRVSQTESMLVASHRAVPFSYQALVNNGSITFFLLCSKYHNTNTSAVGLPASDFTVLVVDLRIPSS